ncbi:MAG: beta-glucosidase BglX [Candidatus Dadabacteria bacterium]
MRHYRSFSLFFLLVLIFIVSPVHAQKKTISQRVDSLMRLMTLDEKIGQLNQLNGPWAHTGPITEQGDLLEQVKKGRIGSMLNVNGVTHTTELQKIALQSRLHIPLLFGQDVIHGYRTTFPIPLAEACSWDLDIIERSERIAATEAAAGGIHWTFAPMVDIARDPRWGRVMEGAGEDPYLGALIAAARVRGFQGTALGNINSIMACAKHFAAYGAAIGGRDYGPVDMSNRLLWQVYLQPFKAAAEAGVATFMNSFNDINGIPATGSHYLQREILKGDWKFKGFIVSDWGSIGEMINHGYVKNNYEAAEKAILAGNDMDMESRSYIDNLHKLVNDKKVPVSLIDEAVKRILTKKFEMGLFDNPLRYMDAAREQRELNNPANKEVAREMAKKSIVLLKNDKQLLPLSKGLRTIAVIGPLGNAKMQMEGFWSIDWPDSNYIVSQLEGIRNKVGNSTNVLYAKGCDIEDSSRAGFEEAIAAARQADVVILSVGEKRDMSGEAKSRSNIHIPGIQEDLVKAIYATGKPVVMLINAGRPLIFPWSVEHIPAIVYTWWLGNEAGNAIADVLFGDYNPSGKLPITFPRTEGQIPIYYSHFNTGRPATNDTDRFYRSAYIDLSIYPQYEFGYGLSYTTFRYSDLKLSSKKMNSNGSIRVSCTITNTGKVAGEEIVQLYIRDKVAQPVRPVKELKDFKKILLQPGESKKIEFVINKEKLSFYDEKAKWIVQPGEFDLMIGSSSRNILLRDTFELAKSN